MGQKILTAPTTFWLPVVLGGFRGLLKRHLEPGPRDCERKYEVKHGLIYDSL